MCPCKKREQETSTEAVSVQEERTRKRRERFKEETVVEEIYIYIYTRTRVHLCKTFSPPLERKTRALFDRSRSEAKRKLIKKFSSGENKPQNFRFNNCLLSLLLGNGLNI